MSGAMLNQYSFNANSDVVILFPKFEFTVDRAMFISTLANKIAFKYSYGRKLTLNRLRNETILLPIKNEEIDFELYRVLVVLNIYI